MAYTKTDFSLAAGFTPADVLDKLGEVFAQMGVMSTATDWYDEFTDTNGSTVKIMRMVYNGDTYGTIYHAFFHKATFDGIWYTAYYNWDLATHESLGTFGLDHVSQYEHPDDLSASSWSSYYSKIDSFDNAAATSFSTFTEGNEIPWLFIVTAGGQRFVGFVPTTQQPTVGIYDHNTLGPMSMLGANCNSLPTLSTTCLLNRAITGSVHSDGTSGGDWAPSAAMSGLELGGGITRVRLTGLMDNSSGGAAPWGISPQGSSYNSEISTMYTGILDLPIAANVYPDLGLGAGFMMMSGWNEAAWTPQHSDTIVITAGVEEYFVVRASPQLTTNFGIYGANWFVYALRVV